MNLPKPILALINSFERLPGIGPKTAQRLAFYLLRVPSEDIAEFSHNLAKLKSDTKLCSICKNVDEVDPCNICTNSLRDPTKIIVTSSPLDVYAFEKVGFKGKYHVLHGVINPLDNIGPDELYINELIKRLTDQIADSADVKGQTVPIELILATNTSMEGEATAMYIAKVIKDRGYKEDEIRVTRIARGLPVGGDIEYADDVTLSRALEGRLKF
ncbi:recombination protein RecR [candidate division WWE3 bacterium]|nr:recombination protein RecR [candidate division WWE3 bacterium]